MQRRMIGKGQWYLKYWGEFQCRDWYLRTKGQTRPLRVEFIKLTTRIPSPDQVARKGWYKPKELKVKTSVVKTHKCAHQGEPSLEIKARYGLSINEEDRERAARAAQVEARKYKNRRMVWERRRHFFGSKPKKRAAAAQPRPRERPKRPGAAAAVTPDQE
jgi:hypothetical protein